MSSNLQVATAVSLYEKPPISPKGFKDKSKTLENIDPELSGFPLSANTLFFVCVTSAVLPGEVQIWGNQFLLS